MHSCAESNGTNFRVLPKLVPSVENKCFLMKLKMRVPSICTCTSFMLHIAHKAKGDSAASERLEYQKNNMQNSILQNICICLYNFKNYTSIKNYFVLQWHNVFQNMKTGAIQQQYRTIQ